MMNETVKIGRQEAGMTLVEMVIGMIMLSFFALSILMFLKPVMDLWVLQVFQQGAATEARMALMRMVREINQIESRTAIATANATQLSFTRLTENGGTESVAYTISSGNLMRSASGSAVVMAKGISGFSFQYFNVDNNAPGASEDIRRVGIQMTAAGSGTSATLVSHAQPRNVY